MRKEIRDKHFLHKPTYPGGPESMKKFIYGNLKYPKMALDSKIEGIVQVKITIDNKGVVVDTHLLHSLGHGCDEEALRVVKLLKFEVPKNRGMKVRFFKKINIQFRLQQQSNKPSGINVTYQVGTSTTSSPITYSYTIVPSPVKKDVNKP